MAEPERLSKRNAIRQENEQRILSAAEKVFAEAGFGGATMQLIADMAGLPKANLHYYFPTKEALYRAWCRTSSTSGSMPPTVSTRPPDPSKGLAPISTPRWRFRAATRTAPRSGLEVMHGAPVIQDYLETTLRDWTAGRAALIQRWIDEGKMAPVNPDHLLYMLWATTQHYADFGHQIETLNGGKPLSDKQWKAAKDSVKEIILRGIGAI
jgi:TetR/AcrR family transcriptional regulator